MMKNEKFFATLPCQILKKPIMIVTSMKRPETVALTYDKTNPIAQKTLDFFLSLGLFRVEKIAQSQVEIGLEEYRQGKYTVINRGKRKVSDE